MPLRAFSRGLRLRNGLLGTEWSLCQPVAHNPTDAAIPLDGAGLAGREHGLLSGRHGGVRRASGLEFDA